MTHHQPDGLLHSGRQTSHPCSWPGDPGCNLKVAQQSKLLRQPRLREPQHMATATDGSV